MNGLQFLALPLASHLQAHRRLRVLVKSALLLVARSYTAGLKDRMPALARCEGIITGLYLECLQILAMQAFKVLKAAQAF